jgi:hypothetical protein
MEIADIHAEGTVPHSTHHPLAAILQVLQKHTAEQGQPTLQHTNSASHKLTLCEKTSTLNPVRFEERDQSTHDIKVMSSSEHGGQALHRSEPQPMNRSSGSTQAWRNAKLGMQSSWQHAAGDSLICPVQGWQAIQVRRPHTSHLSACM